jgi:thiamine biosynthesis lipoprotein
VTQGTIPAVPGAHRFSHHAMAAVFEIHCLHPNASYARQASRAAFDLVDRLEQDLSRFVANSDVARINDLAAGQATRVSPSTLECLEIASRMYEVTGGAFDVAIGSGLPRLAIDPEELVVRALADGIRIDLGGIGKGYAVDRVADLLEEWEIRQALVHGGFSSVLAMEAPPEQDGWPLTLSAPAPGEPEVLARISACRRVLSASGTRKRDHIRDPRSGLAVRGRAAWVALPREGDDLKNAAAIAEAFSTAFTVLSGLEAAGLHRKWPGLEAWLVEESGLAHLAPRLGSGGPSA